MSVYTTAKNSKKAILLLIGAILIFTMIGLVKGTRSLTSYWSQNKVVMQVGQEKLYQSDFDYEESYFGQNIPNKRRIILNKMASDSMKLQQATKENIISTNQTIYNSTSKDYSARINTIRSIEENFKQKQNKLEGYIFTLWFMNSKPAAIGYDAGKKEALRYLTEVRNEIVAKKLSPDQALKKMQSDTTLARLDEGYRNNVGYKFSATDTRGPIFDIEYNTLLWNLSAGDISEIKVIKDITSPLPNKESMYTFGIISHKTGSPSNISYSQWLNELSKKYEVTYY